MSCVASTNPCPTKCPPNPTEAEIDPGPSHSSSDNELEEVGASMGNEDVQSSKPEKIDRAESVQDGEMQLSPEALEDALNAMEQARPTDQSTKPRPRCLDGLKPRPTTGGVSMRKC